MSQELLSALLLFAFVSSITPGPNNLMLLASGANFGFQRTIPHMLGISLGFFIMVVLVGVGLVQIFERFPQVYTALKICSVLYLSYLAWKIAHAAAPEAEAVGKPFTFLQAALFQWVNPKAWAMSLTALSVYAPNQQWTGVLAVASAFVVVNLPSICCWTIAGQQLQRILSKPKHLRIFNILMALLLLASLYPVLFGG